jgi:gliding motility-associated-like protein
VYARADVFVPNAFSPNGDGVNDVFYPRGTGIFRVRNLRIFNRWGEVVFERSGFQANDPTSGWDGRSRGTRLNPDTYVYVMEIIADNSTSQVFKGDVTMLQ